MLLLPGESDPLTGVTNDTNGPIYLPDPAPPAPSSQLDPGSESWSDFLSTLTQPIRDYVATAGGVANNAIDSAEAVFGHSVPAHLADDATQVATHATDTVGTVAEKAPAALLGLGAGITVGTVLTAAAVVAVAVVLGGLLFPESAASAATRVAVAKVAG